MQLECLMDQFTKVSGLKIFVRETAKECKSGKMAQSTKDNGRAIQLTAKVGSFKERVTSISVSGK